MDLLDKAKSGKLTDEELKYVVQRIKTSTPDNEDPNLYTLLHILGKAGLTPTDTKRTGVAVSEVIRHRKLIEKFLYYPTDPMISKIALQTLGDHWGFYKDYLSQIKEFVKGVEWDKDEDVRIIAISSAGAFLRETTDKDKELVQLLVNILISDQKEEIMRDCAYYALAYAAGQEWSDILRDENKPNPLILEKVYQMLKSAK